MYYILKKIVYKNIYILRVYLNKFKKLKLLIIYCVTI